MGAAEGAEVGRGVRLGAVEARPVAAAVVVRPDFDFSKTSYSFNTHMQAADAVESPSAAWAAVGEEAAVRPAVVEAGEAAGAA